MTSSIQKNLENCNYIKKFCISSISFGEIFIQILNDFLNYVILTKYK